MKTGDYKYKTGRSNYLLTNHSFEKKSFTGKCPLKPQSLKCPLAYERGRSFLTE